MRWTEEKIAARLALIEPLVYRRSAPVGPFRYLALPDPLTPPPVSPDADDSAWEVIEPGNSWGRWQTDFVLRARFAVPADWDASAPVDLYLPLGEAENFSHPEALAYVDGIPYAACDRHHQEIILRPEWRDGRTRLLALHGWTGIGRGWPGDPSEPSLFMRPCQVVQIDQPTRDFLATARVALGGARALGENDPARGRLLNGLDEAFRLLDTREPLGERFYASVAPAHETLRAVIAAAGPPLDVDLVAAGHAHIDVAWLWTLGQTRRKAGRTFHTVLRLMEQFPHFHFTQSQPQLYDYVREDYPALWEAIRERVADGRWEPIGGMWVEADCNLSGPESLARQLILGRAFFREQFGAGRESPVLWLPDVFGYAWCLPQLVKQAGLDYFMTIKISWSEYNRLPYDSFWWQGLDGTRLLTHFSTVPERGSSTTYNAAATPQQVTGAWENFQQKELQHVLLMAYGFGDGGGGPTRETLENLREMEAFPSIPRARQGKVIDFFQQMEQEAGPRLPVWNGELYLEYHRGTYTTQAANKRANRKSEFLLHDAEYLATQATLMDETYEYPHDMLRQAWKLVCLNQFHDIIPGSSIREVYVESLVQYTEVGRLAGAVRDEATEVIQRHCSGALLLLNPSSFKRSDLAFWSGDLPPVDSLGRDDGRPVMIQPAQGGIWIDAGEIAPYSGLCLQWTGEAAPQRDTSLRVTPTLLENQHLRVEFNDAGDITRIYDRRNGREVLSPGTIANQFQAFEDRPKNWDAWDIDINYDDRMWVAEPASAIEVIEEGPLRATLQITRQILHSTFTQRISLTHNSARLDFDTTVQWRERHILLKVAFPVDILAPAATYEIQWGNVERPTHRNTSWDWARFESFAQKWVDLSEGGYGVSLLNDCKYGHDIQDNVLRLSLLRAPTWPDPEADQGEHRFTYSLLPHRGDWREETIPAAYALNDPLLVSGITGSGPEGRSIPSLVSVSQPHVVIETVKQAEDGDGIIVRLYESQRQRGAVSLTTGFSLQQAWLVNLLEENQSPLAAKDNRVEFSIRPFQIVTLRLVPIARRA